jgi:hypothetical protein
MALRVYPPAIPARLPYAGLMQRQAGCQVDCRGGLANAAALQSYVTATNLLRQSVTVVTIRNY